MGSELDGQICLGSDPPPPQAGWDACCFVTVRDGVLHFFGVWGNPNKKHLQFVIGILGPGELDPMHLRLVGLSKFVFSLG